jgi:hypothetical protein
LSVTVVFPTPPFELTMAKIRRLAVSYSRGSHGEACGIGGRAVGVATALSRKSIDLPFTLTLAGRSGGTKRGPTLPGGLYDGHQTEAINWPLEFAAHDLEWRTFEGGVSSESLVPAPASGSDNLVSPSLVPVPATGSGWGGPLSWLTEK